MRPWLPTTLLLLGLVTTARAQQAAAPDQTLAEARRGFETKLLRQERESRPLAEPPEDVFTLARYKGPVGDLTAYVSTPPEPGKKYPAIIWVTGGFPPGGAGESAWEDADPDNDQTAQAYRHAGLVMMYPTTRGTAGNPGVQESFLGEVDDVLAAADHLRTLDFVDPERIYLGGHSTGGTLALLVAEATDRFKAVICFGPVEDPRTYGDEPLLYDPKDEREARIRAPIHFLAGVRSPTFVIEGEDGRSNIEPLRAMQRACTNPALHFLSVAGADHFLVLAPVNALIARKLAAGGPLELTQQEVQAVYDEERRSLREADDLDSIARARRAGASLTTPCPARHYLLSRERAALEAAAKAAPAAGFQAGAVEQRTGRDRRPFFLLVLTKTLTLHDLDAVFATSAAAERLAKQSGADYRGWEAGGE
jgi:dienelactone hydrolase